MSRVEIFSKEQFEMELPVDKNNGQLLWKYIGIRSGEHAYLVPIRQHNVAIEVRSSVKSDGHSAGSGEDSIRCWLVDATTFEPMGSKISRWTTRLPGWGERTKTVIRKLWEMGRKIIPCPSCNEKNHEDSRLRCFKVKKVGPNNGRLFLKCQNQDCKHFEWISSEKEV